MLLKTYKSIFLQELFPLYDEKEIETYLSSIYGEGNTSNIIEYHMMDMVYSYNTANDGQRIYRKILKKHDVADGIYSYDEELLPPHRFPCTDDIIYKTSIKRISYKINNRIYINYDQELGENDDITYKYLYLSYRHSENVDLKKINIDISRACKSLRRMNIQW